MLRPSASSLVTLGALAALISAIAYALSGIMVRVLTRTDSTTSVIVWTVGLMTLFIGRPRRPGLGAARPRHYRWLILLGGLAAIGPTC